jgi:hypothetical protein
MDIGNEIRPAQPESQETAVILEPSFFEKLKLLFFEPVKLFESLKRKSSWLPPLIALVLVSVILGMIAQPYIMPSIRESTVSYLSKIPNLPDGTIDKVTESFDKAQDNGFLKNLGTTLLGVVFIKAVLAFFFVVTIIFLVGSILFGGTAKYIKVMSLYAWIMPIWILGAIIVTPLMIAKQTFIVSLSPAMLIPYDPSSSLFYFLRNFSIFNIWAIIVLGIGFSVIYGISRTKGIIAIIAVWAIWIVINSFIPYLNFQVSMTGLT